MISVISVKDRLKNQAREDGRTMQEELVTYGLERIIYRLSISEYAERFTLKGGTFLYALFEGNYARATMDKDGNSIVYLEIEAKSGNSGSPVISTETGKVVGILSGIQVGGKWQLHEKMPWMIPIQHFNKIIRLNE